MSANIGFLNLNKPSGFTSHDCVAKIRRLLNLKKVGHGGTLDPAATGVLPIAVGGATRLLQFLPTDKAYQARIRFGVTTTTDDLEGEIMDSQANLDLSLEEIKPLLGQFLGKIEQIPPAYSAIQRDGKRLYELARKGEVVEVPVRTVEIYQIEVLNWYPGEYSELELNISCGSGTYIRAIARDLGTVLGVGGTLAKLKRTASCGLNIGESITFEDIEQQLANHTFALIPPEIAVQHLETVTLEPELAKRWCQGQKIPDSRFPVPNSPVRVHHKNGQFLGIGQFITTSEQVLLTAKVVFPLLID